MILKSEKGMAMVFALFIGIITVVVSSVFWYTSSSRTIHATRNENQTKAYYFARSGVDAAVGLLQKDDFFPCELPLTYSGDLENGFQEVDVDNYSVKFTISEIIGKGLQIQSWGQVGGAQGSQSNVEDLKLLLSGWTATSGKPDDADENTNSNSYTFDYAVFAKEDITLDGSASIEGPVGTNSGYVAMGNSKNCKITNAGAYPGKLYLGPGAGVNKPGQTQGVEQFSPEKELPAVPNISDLPAFPDYPDYPEYPDIDGIVPEQLDVSSNKTVDLNLAAIKVYNKINFGWGKTLTFNLNEDRTVIIKDISSSGNINIIGDGHLLLVVEKNLDSLSNINVGGDHEHLIVLFTGTSISRPSDSKFLGKLYAQNATFSTNNNVVMKGDLVIGGNSVYIGSSNNIEGSIYAPNASISTNNLSNISGNILTGGTNFNFNGVSHNGNIYASNDNAVIKYNGNRSYVAGTTTNIYSKGIKVEINSAHLQGDIHLSNQSAEFDLGGSSTFSGNIYTKGTLVYAYGNAVYQGYIYAPNLNSEIDFQGSFSINNGGGIITAGSKVSFTGNVVAHNCAVFAPNADAVSSGSSTIYGAVVSKTFDGGNGNRAAVSYVSISTDDFPISIGGGEGSVENTTSHPGGGIWIQ